MYPHCSYNTAFMHSFMSKVNQLSSVRCSFVAMNGVNCKFYQGHLCNSLTDQRNSISAVVLSPINIRAKFDCGNFVVLSLA